MKEDGGLWIRMAEQSKPVPEQRWTRFFMKTKVVRMNILSNHGQEKYMGLSLVTFYGKQLEL